MEKFRCESDEEEEEPAKEFPVFLSRKRKAVKGEKQGRKKKQKPVYPDKLAKKIKFHPPSRLQHTPKTDGASRASDVRRTPVTTNAEIHPESSGVQLMEISNVTDTLTLFDAVGTASVSTAARDVQEEVEKQKALKKKTMQPASVVLPHLQVNDWVPSETPPDSLKVFSMGDMLKAFPCMTVRGEKLVTQEHDQHIKDPVNRILKQHVAQLEKPVTKGTNLSPQMLGQLLRTRQKRLPLMTAAMESELLQEAGTFSVPGKPGLVRTYAPCKRGEDCVARRDHMLHGPKGGFVLMGFMYEEEYNHFMETGTGPMEPRACVLCLRAHVTSYILSLRHHFKRVDEVEGGFVCHCVRNLVDQPGGYNSVDVFRPSPHRWEGLVDPIAAYNVSKLVARKRNQRWMVDQSAMVWQKPEVPKPLLAESVQSFRKRVAQAVGRGPLGSTAQTRQVVKQWHAAVDLPEIVLRAEDDRLKAWAGHLLRLDASFMKEISPSQRSKSHVDVLWPFAKYYSPLFHEPGINRVHECCFWNDTRNVKDQMVHLLSKVIPQPCQTRRFSDMLGRLFGIPKAQIQQLVKGVPGVLQKVVCTKTKSMVREEEVSTARHWVTVSLFGTLPQANQRLPIALIRCVVNHLVSKGDHMMDGALVGSDGVCTFGLREYLCYAVESCPQTKECLKRLFDWDKFARISREAMDEIRALVAPAKTALEFFECLMSEEVKKVCRTRHGQVLEVAYQRQRASLMSILHTCIRGRQGKFVVHATEDQEPDVKYTLPRETIEVLVDWFDRLDLRTCTLETDVWPFLPYLGVPERVASEILDICSRYDNERMGKRELRAILNQFNVTHGECMYAIQSVCCLWKDAEFPRFYPLPLHMIENQLDALRTRFGLPHDAPVPAHRVVLHYCPVCDKIYSIFREFTDPKGGMEAEGMLKAAAVLYPVETPFSLKQKKKRNQRNKSKGKSYVSAGTRSCQPTDEYGVVGAQRDYRTGQLYCLKNNVCGFRKCRDQPLLEIPLLGRVLELKSGKCVMLCPQKGCGIATEINAKRGNFTERGLSCSLCTLRQNAEVLQKALLAFNMTDCKGYQCAVCGNSCHATRAYVYPQGLVLCSTHHSARLSRYLVTHFLSKWRDDNSEEPRPQTPQQWCKVIVAFIARLEEEKLLRDSKRMKFQLAQSRLRTRSKNQSTFH